MTWDELIAACKAAGPNITLVSPTTASPLPRKGWPRGTLLCNNSAKGSVWMYNTAKLIAAIEKNVLRFGEKKS